MPLPLLIALVATALSIVALVLHALGFSRVAPWDTATARAAWLREYPDALPDHVRLAANGRAALVQIGAQRGVVWQLGMDSVAHFLTPDQATETPRGLKVRFADFGVPGLTVALDAQEKHIWIKELKA